MKWYTNTENHKHRSWTNTFAFYRTGIRDPTYHRSHFLAESWRHAKESKAISHSFIHSFILVCIQHTNGEHLLVSGPVPVVGNLKIIKTQSLLLRGLQPSGAADVESFSHRGLSSKLSGVLGELLHRRVRT